MSLKKEIKENTVKKAVIAGVLGGAMALWGTGFAPSVYAQGMLEGLMGLIEAQDQAGTLEETAPAPSPFALPEEPSEGQEEWVEPALPDTGEEVVPGPQVPEEVSPVLPEEGDEGVVPEEVSVTPVQPVF